MDNAEYISLREAAEIIGIKYHTLAARIMRGRVKAKKNGQLVLVPMAEVQRLRMIKELQEASC